MFNSANFLPFLFFLLHKSNFYRVIFKQKPVRSLSSLKFCSLSFLRWHFTNWNVWFILVLLEHVLIRFAFLLGFPWCFPIGIPMMVLQMEIGMGRRRGGDEIQKNRVFATSYVFLITISLQPTGVFISNYLFWLIK